MNYTCTIDSPLGILTLSSDGENLNGLWLENQKYFGSIIKSNNIINVRFNELPIFEKTKIWLEEYFEGKNSKIDLKLSPVGGEFRQMVWDILIKIPYGELVTYGDIAKEISRKMGKKSMSAQAIGNAVGHNPISIIIPCHRVIGKNGSLTGYAGGIEIKEKLLKLEKAKINIQ